MSVRQYYYFDLTRLSTKYYINVSTTQISGICWKPIIQEFYGLERHVNNDGNITFRHVELEEEWVYENISSDIIGLVISKAREDSNRYFKIPIGNSRPITSSNEIKNNPIIEFKEYGNNTCVFTSMSSALHYMGYEDMAVTVDNFKSDYMERHYLDGFQNMIGVVANFLANSSLKFFRQKFNMRKIKHCPRFNLLEKCSEDTNTLYHVVLRSSDGAANHSVCIIHKWIFDGNFSNALTLNKKNLDLSCDSNFVGIHSGHFYYLK